MKDDNNGSGDQILRVEKNRNYKTLNLHAIADDADLSWKAVGLLSYLLSRPDNWSFNRSDIIRRHSDGRRAVQSGLQELEDAGYLEREQLRSEGGHFQYRWTVYERPGVDGDTKRASAEAHSPSTDDPSTDTVPHSSEESSKEEVSAHQQPAGARAKLRAYLNGHGEVVGVFHERFGSSSPTWAQAVWGQYIGGVREDIWRGIPEGERPKILAATLWSFIGDADEYDNRLFEAYLKRRIEGWQERDRAEKMPEGVTAGDAQILDFRERIEHVDLGA